MVKKLIIDTILLPIYDSPNEIQYAWIILDIIMIDHYVLHHKKRLYYIKHVFYCLEKIKIALKQYQPIHSNLC